MQSLISQQQRLLTLNTVLDQQIGPNCLVLRAVTGQEALGECFEFELDVLVQGLDNSQQLNQVLQTHASVCIHDKQGVSRYIHGLIHAVSYEQTGQAVNVARLRLVPDLWRLQHVTRQLTYENLSLPTIIQAIMQRNRISAYQLSALQQDYAPIAYEVQNNETDYDFLQRLLQPAGVFFYFTMHADHHQLHFVDDSHVLPAHSLPLPYSNANPEQHHVHQWQTMSELSMNQLAYSLANPLKPLKPHRAAYSHAFKKTVLPLAYQADYPYAKATPNSLQAAARRDYYRKLWPAHTITAASNAPQIAAGDRLAVSDVPNSEQGRYTVLRVEHHAYDETQLLDASLPSQPDRNAQAYHNTLTLLGEQFPFVPVITVATANAYGLQPAIVRGEHKAKTMADTAGRQVVDLAWPKTQCTCPVKNRQWQSGQRWGSQLLPRAGDEVLLAFDHGLANRPWIMGSCYNQQNMPPYALPESAYQSGWRSRSQASQDKQQANELRFDDSATTASVYLKAQADLQTTAAKNSDLSIQHQAIHVVEQGDLHSQVGKQALHYAAKSLTLKANGGTITLTPSLIDIKSDHIAINS